MLLLLAKMTFLLPHLFTFYPVHKPHLTEPCLATSSEDCAAESTAWHLFHFPGVLHNATVKGKGKHLKSAQLDVWETLHELFLLEICCPHFFCILEALDFHIQ